jgi:CBS domain-containing protein
MVKPPIVAVADEDLGEVAARMISERIGGLPVVLHGRLVGMITSSDLLGHIVAQMYTPAPDRG